MCLALVFIALNGVCLWVRDGFVFACLRESEIVMRGVNVRVRERNRKRDEGVVCSKNSRRVRGSHLYL